MPPHLPKDRFDALLAYLTYLREQLGLNGWTMHLSHRPADSRSDWPEVPLAAVDVTYGRRDFTVYVSSSWETESQQTRRHALVHELIHVILDPVDRVSRQLEDVLGSEAYDLHRGAFRERIEHAVDHCAEVVARHLETQQQHERRVTRAKPKSKRRTSK